jgi:hypothetical protein
VYVYFLHEYFEMYQRDIKRFRKEVCHETTFVRGEKKRGGRFFFFFFFFFFHVGVFDFFSGSSAHVTSKPAHVIIKIL